MTHKLTKRNKNFSFVLIPDEIRNIAQLLQRLYPSISLKIITCIIISKMFEVFSSKRICFDESGRINFTNWFALIFLPSGGGKDRLVDNLDTFVFKSYFDWFKTQSQKAIEKCSNEDYKKLKLVAEIQNATPEGISLLGKMLSDINFGAIYVKIPELGLYIENGDKRIKQFLSILCSLYSCVIPNKIIKSEIFQDVITGIPTNVLAYSDYTLFLDNIRSYFNKILNTGYGRRFIINFQENLELSTECLSDSDERNIYEKLENIGTDIFQNFEKVQFYACYKLLPESKNFLNSYKIETNLLHNKERNPLLQREINSRELKALKLSCLFAALNHSNELVINSDDMKQAIDTVEFLSQDFRKFLNYKPSYDDKYKKAYKFLRDNIGREYTKGQLMEVFCSQFGFRREVLRHNYYNDLCAIWEIANENGYTIIQNSTKYIRCKVYSLIPQEFGLDSKCNTIYTFKQQFFEDGAM